MSIKRETSQKNYDERLVDDPLPEFQCVVTDAQKIITTKPRWKYPTRVFFAPAPCDDVPLPLHVITQNSNQFVDMNCGELLEEFQRQLSFNDNQLSKRRPYKISQDQKFGGNRENIK